MKLSTRGRYGLKAIYELALHYGEGPIPLNEVANKQKLSESYLEQLFLSLRKDKLIKSVRGAQGGYMLNRKPEDITVGDVLRCLEGNIAPALCLEDGVKEECSMSDECITKYVWSEIKNSLDNVIDSITLEDMINKDNKNISIVKEI